MKISKKIVVELCKKKKKTKNEGNIERQNFAFRLLLERVFCINLMKHIDFRRTMKNG